MVKMTKKFIKEFKRDLQAFIEGKNVKDLNVFIFRNKSGKLIRVINKLELIKE